MMIRKVFVRAMGSNSTILNRTISSLAPSLIQSHSFSTGAPTHKDSIDATLYKLLKHEIKSLKFTLSNHIPQVKTLLDSFRYKIHHEHSDLVLERRLVDDGEKVTITIHMPYVQHDMKEFECSFYEDDKEGIEAIYIRMSVSVQKCGTGDVLHFQIDLSTEDTVIRSISFDNNNQLLHFLGIDGSKFKELDARLQQSLLCKYLETRGIKGNTVSTLLKYIAVYDNKLYLRALKDLVGFIEN